MLVTSYWTNHPQGENIVMRPRILLVALLTLTFISPFSRATLITQDLIAVDDGLTVLDTTTETLWLKTSFTYNMNYDQVMTLLGTNNLYDGYRVAKKSEVNDILTRYELGAGSYLGAPTSNPDAIKRALGFYNTMVSTTSLSEGDDWLVYAHGLAMEDGPTPSDERLLSERFAYYTMQLFHEGSYDPMVFYPDWPTNDYGNAAQGGWFLVKSVPEPMALPLLALGIFGLLFMRHKQSR